MFDSIKIQNQLNWLREQIECIKDNSCMCTHETDVLLSPGGVLTVIFTDGSVHSVTLPGNEVDGNIYTQSGVYDINTGLCTFTRTDGSVYYLNLNYLKTQAETALATATLSITRIDNLTGEVTSNTELISLLQEGLDNHLSDFNNPHQVTKEQVGLGDALVSGDNVSSLVNDAGYIVIGDVPPAPVITVAGKIGNVLLYKADILDLNEADYATAAQGLLADSALQSGDNISELNNDVGYITDYTVTESDVTQHQSALTITESQISDLNTFSGDYNDLTNQPDIPTDNNELTNGAGYITLSEVPSTPDAPVDSVNGLTGVVILDADDIETTVGSGVTVLDALNDKADATDLEDYLPLTGGTLTGLLNANGGLRVKTDVDDKEITISSNGITYNKNSSLQNVWKFVTDNCNIWWSVDNYSTKPMKLGTNGQLTLTEQLNANGGVVIGSSTKVIQGGFGGKSAEASDGSGTSWNDETTSGQVYKLKWGQSPNGPGVADYFHVFNYEYSSNNGTGNLTQVAYPYYASSQAKSHTWLRSRYSGNWTAWYESANTADLGNYLPLAGGTMDAGAVVRFVDEFTEGVLEITRYLINISSNYDNTVFEIGDGSIITYSTVGERGVTGPILILPNGRLSLGANGSEPTISLDIDTVRGTQIFTINNETDFLSPVNTYGGITTKQYDSQTGAPTGNIGHISVPKGGMYHSTASVVTGALRIKLPTNKNANDMLSFYVDIFEYQEDESVNYKISGYNNTGGWTRVTAICLTNKTNQHKAVRFGNDGVNDIVYIGEGNSTWNYPQVLVRDFYAGYTANIITYQGVWIVDFFTGTPSSVTKTVSDTLPKTDLNIGGTSFSGEYPMTVNVDGTIYSDSDITYNGATKTLGVDNVKTTTFEFGGETIKRYVFKGTWNMATTSNIGLGANAQVQLSAQYGKEIMDMKCVIQGDGATNFGDYTNTYANLEGRGGTITTNDYLDGAFIQTRGVGLTRGTNTYWTNTTGFGPTFNNANYTVTIDIIQ